MVPESVEIRFIRSLRGPHALFRKRPQPIHKPRLALATVQPEGCPLAATSAVSGRERLKTIASETRLTTRLLPP